MNPEEKQEQNQEAVELETDTDVETDDKTLQTEIARKRHWRDKAQKTIEENKKLQEELTKYKSAPESPKASPDDIETVLDLRSQGFSDGEVLKLRHYSKKMNTPISEIVNDPFIRAGIESEREKSKIQIATPKPSNRAISVGGKSWSEMSDKERRENFSKMSSQYFKK